MVHWPVSYFSLLAMHVYMVICDIVQVLDMFRISHEDNISTKYELDHMAVCSPTVALFGPDLYDAL